MGKINVFRTGIKDFNPFTRPAVKNFRDDKISSFESANAPLAVTSWLIVDEIGRQSRRECQDFLVSADTVCQCSKVMLNDQSGDMVKFITISQKGKLGSINRLEMVTPSVRNNALWSPKTNAFPVHFNKFNGGIWLGHRYG